MSVSIGDVWNWATGSSKMQDFRMNRMQQGEKLVAAYNNTFDNIPADDFMEMVKGFTEAEQTTKALDAFANNELARNGMLDAAGEYASFMSSAVGKVPADAVLEFAEYMVENENARLVSGKCPSIMMGALRTLSERCPPEDRESLLTTLDQDGTFLSYLTANSTKWDTADFFINMTSELDADTARARLAGSAGFQSAQVNEGFIDHLLTENPGLVQALNPDYVNGHEAS
ncbi:MAG: hypothetical protein ACRBDL_07330 [Alphaproteobacteria bacterium]